MDSLDKDTSATKCRGGWTINNEPWRTEAACFSFRFGCFCMFLQFWILGGLFKTDLHVRQKEGNKKTYVLGLKELNCFRLATCCIYPRREQRLLYPLLPLAGFRFLLLLIRLPLILHLFCVRRFVSVAFLQHAALESPDCTNTMLQVKPSVWWMLLCFYWFFDTPHVKKTLYVSGPGILSSIIKAVFQALSKFFFFNAVKRNKWARFSAAYRGRPWWSHCWEQLTRTKVEQCVWPGLINTHVYGRHKCVIRESGGNI